MKEIIPDYSYSDAAPTWANAYLWPALKGIIHEQGLIENDSASGLSAFDLGCGNGATANMLSQIGFEVVGVDPSESGIINAKKAFPHCRFDIASTYDDLSPKYGTFSLVVSLEVIEHCYSPYRFARTFHSLIQPGGGRNYFHTLSWLYEKSGACSHR